jgi:ABC-2 type transport system permease protein
MGVFRNEIMDDTHNLWLTIKFEMRKHFRRRRFLISMGIALLTALLFTILPLIVGADFPDTGLAFAYRNLGFTDMLIVIAAAIFAGDAIAGEFEKKTGLILFPTPQRRTTIFLGKYIAAVIPVILTVGVYYVVMVGSISVIYGFDDVPMELVYSFLIAIVYLFSIVSMIYLFSSFMKRSISSSLVGFFLVMMILPIISMILNASDIEPWFIVTYSGDLITTVLEYTAETQAFGPGANMASLSEPDTLVGLIMMVVYAIGGFASGLFLALRRRME